MKKIFLLLPAFVCLFCLKANCMSWEDELIVNQTTSMKKFPVVSYKSWSQHEVGGTLEEKSTSINGPATFIVVPGAFTPTCTSKHIKFFV